MTAAALETSMVEQLQNLARRDPGPKLRWLLQTLEAQPQTSSEVQTAVRAVVEGVTYDGASGEVVIRLRGHGKERAHA